MPENEAGAEAEAPEAEVNSEGETPQLEAAEEKPSIETVSALSNEELHDLLGHKKQIEEVRKGLGEAAKLKGAARKYAEERIADMFRPDIYVGGLKYLAEDAIRATKKKDGLAALMDDSPCSVID